MTTKARGGAPRRRRGAGCCSRSATSTRRSTPDKWGMVGGHVEDGEDFEPAAYRELEEETGIRLEPGGLTLWRDERYAWTPDQRRRGTTPSGSRRTRLTDADIVLGEGRQIVFVAPDGGPEPRPRDVVRALRAGVPGLAGVRRAGWVASPHGPPAHRHPRPRARRRGRRRGRRRLGAHRHRRRRGLPGPPRRRPDRPGRPHRRPAARPRAAAGRAACWSATPAAACSPSTPPPAAIEELTTTVDGQPDGVLQQRRGAQRRRHLVHRLVPRLRHRPVEGRPGREHRDPAGCCGGPRTARSRWCSTGCGSPTASRWPRTSPTSRWPRPPGGPSYAAG